MYDTRVEVWNNDEGTVSADATTNGSTIDLLSEYVGDHREGTGYYGVGVQIILAAITGNAFSVTFKWQVSDDGSTWVDDQQIYTVTDITAAKGPTNGLKLSTRLRTPRRYARIVRVVSGISGADASFNQKAFVADGSTFWGFATQVRK